MTDHFLNLVRAIETLQNALAAIGPDVELAEIAVAPRDGAAQKAIAFAVVCSPTFKNSASVTAPVPLHKPFEILGVKLSEATSD